MDICDTVEFHFRRDPSPSSRRAKCRRWGVVYLYCDQETPGPGDTTPPPTEPLAPESFIPP